MRYRIYFYIAGHWILDCIVEGEEVGQKFDRLETEGHKLLRAIPNAGTVYSSKE